MFYTGDYAIGDNDGYFWLLGRADEVLKIAGHRIGAIEVEDAAVSHPSVTEAAVASNASIGDLSTLEDEASVEEVKRAYEELKRQV